MSQMLKRINRKKILLILNWCIFKFGASKHCDEFPPKLRVYKSMGNANMRDKTDGLRGTYLDGTITIYLGSIVSIKELCETVVHEYKHYLMNDNEYDKLAEKLRKRGRDNEYLKYNHPHEKRARHMEKKWGEVCYRELRKKLYEKP